ncbi:hypothetical protein [Methanosarcina mazei]|uniref:hypothetical protein n=1 Tax=Methanosarcina mazei TaxID=2209 RepID=UPI0012D3A183|nr:hypothetical protein [Methanosarcina mazei]
MSEAKRTAYSRGAIRGEKDCVLPRRNSGRKGLRTPEAQFGAKRTAYSRGAIRGEKDCVLSQLRRKYRESHDFSVPGRNSD